MHPHLLAVIGLLIFLAGLDLLWQSRRDVAYWIASFVRVFRSQMREPKSPVRSFRTETDLAKPHSTLPMLLGMGLAFFGPLLIAVSLSMILYPRL